MTLNTEQFSVGPGGVWQGAEDPETGEQHLTGTPVGPGLSAHGMRMSVHRNPDTIQHEKPFSWMASDVRGVYLQRGAVSTEERAKIAAEGAANRRMEGRDPQTGKHY